MTDTQNQEIRAGRGFFNRALICRIAEGGLEIARDADVTRISYDMLSEIRFHRHLSGRSLLKMETLTGTVRTPRLTPTSTARAEFDGFVQSLLQRVSSASPTTRVVFGPSKTQWMASWLGLLAGGQIGLMLMPVGIALVNLAVVVPIVRSGKPRLYPAADAQAVLG